jgi:hypothetical protein
LLDTTKTKATEIEADKTVAKRSINIGVDASYKHDSLCFHARLILFLTARAYQLNDYFAALNTPSAVVLLDQTVVFIVG